MRAILGPLAQVAKGGAGKKDRLWPFVKRGDCVYTQIVYGVSCADLMPVVRDFADIKESSFQTDCWGA